MPRKAPKKKEPSSADSEGASNNVALQSNSNGESSMVLETEVNSDTLGTSDLSIANSNSSENLKIPPPKESTDGIHEFIFGKSTWVTTTIDVTTTDIQNYFEKQVKDKSLPKKTKLSVFCGFHSSLDKGKNNSSSMGGPFPDFTENLRTALKKVEEKYENIKKEMGYSLSGDINPISLVAGKGIKESCSEEVKDKLEELIDSRRKKPNIILIASCFSEYGDFKEFLQESGLCSVVLLKNERGNITKGNCFQLDGAQGNIIRLFMEDHWQAGSLGDLELRHLFLSGSFGTGKTLVLTEVCWMRIYFCLRLIREYGKFKNIGSW